MAQETALDHFEKKVRPILASRCYACHSSAANPLQGVFNTRSPDRPNPIGLHRVRILAMEDTRIQVSDMEAIDGTPVIDVKPVLDPRVER